MRTWTYTWYVHSTVVYDSVRSLLSRTKNNRVEAMLNTLRGQIGKNDKKNTIKYKIVESYWTKVLKAPVTRPVGTGQKYLIRITFNQPN